MKIAIAAILALAVGWDPTGRIGPTSASADPADPAKSLETARQALGTLQAQPRLKTELAESRKEMAALQRQAAQVAAPKKPDSPASPPEPAKVVSEAPASAPAPARVAGAAPDLSAVVGGIKQWKQPDGTLFFGESPPVPGSKLIAVIGAEQAPPSNENRE